jgi:predicted chitinase
MLAHAFVTTPLRLTHFLARLGLENGGFRYMEDNERPSL